MPPVPLLTPRPHVNSLLFRELRDLLSTLLSLAYAVTLALICDSVVSVGQQTVQGGTLPTRRLKGLVAQLCHLSLIHVVCSECVLHAVDTMD